MKNLIRKVKEGIRTVGIKMIAARENAKYALSNQRGDQNISTAIVILISVVVGALLLAGLYTLFEDIVLPRLGIEIRNMFDYNG